MNTISNLLDILLFNLLKGTKVSYSHHISPHLRPRCPPVGACQSQFATGVGAPAVDVAPRCAGKAVRGATTCGGLVRGFQGFSQKKPVGPFYRLRLEEKPLI